MIKEKTIIFRTDVSQFKWLTSKSKKNKSTISQVIREIIDEAIQPNHGR